MECIEWLFFDVGSTLMNEEKAYLHRLHDVADAVYETFEKIYDMAVALYKENKKGDLEKTLRESLPGIKLESPLRRAGGDSCEICLKYGMGRKIWQM